MKVLVGAFNQEKALLCDYKSSDGPFSSCTADTISTSHPVAAGWRTVAGLQTSVAKTGLSSKNAEQERRRGEKAVDSSERVARPLADILHRSSGTWC